MSAGRAALLGVFWLGGTLAATSVGLVAVNQVGNDVGDSTVAPLTSGAIQNALRTAETRSPAITPPPAELPDDSETGPTKSVTTKGGVFAARCRNNEVRLVLASPNDGYQTQQDSSGRTVRFVGSREQVVVTLSCRAGSIVATTQTVSLTSSPAPDPVSSPSTSHAPSPEPTEQPETPEPSGG
jgi:hypothetical protein